MEEPETPANRPAAHRHRPKPHLARIFEAVAAVMELDRYGRQRLELIFQDGRLIQWRAHLECRTPRDLARYDDAAAWLVERRRAA